ncbi:carbohydrate kinase [Nocardioides speluncae]|uniref:carbohydrate kinase n=1 Tax=Nocardioides speluncae TaxID=2670337 RepID=UPI000D69FB87|nr:carbohydrate kinase [Nocardioides speluncae]
MHLTKREREIVALLRREPTIKPSAIAERIGSSTAAVNVHLSNLSRKGVVLGRGYLLSDAPGVVVVGGTNVDVKARSAAPATPGTSNPGSASMRPGGVGRNIAENLARLGTRTHLVSVVGRDPLGETVMSQTAAAGVRLEHVLRTDEPTGTYTAVLDSDGELVVAVSAMTATERLGPEHVSEARDLIAASGMVIADGNLRLDTLQHTLNLAAAAGARAVLEPVSVPKARALAPALAADRPLYAVTPNRAELGALTGLPTDTDSEVLQAAASLHDRGVELVWVRLGDRGSLLSGADAEPVTIPAIPTEVDDVTGAGDAALAAFCHALLAGEEPASAVRFGHAAAALTVASTDTVRTDLTERLVRSALPALT